MKISHTRLEDARRNPGQFISNAKNPGKFFGTTHFGYLKAAVARYHKQGLSIALRYLEDSFSKRKYTPKSLAKYRDLLLLYTSRFEHSGEDFVKTKDKIHMDIGSGVQIVGEVGRISLIGGEYNVLVFERLMPSDFATQLRMPLLQDYYAAFTRSPLRQVHVGVYVFEQGISQTKCFAEKDVAKAKAEATVLARRLYRLQQKI